MTEFTPGPWNYRQDYGVKFNIRSETKGVGSAAGEANARLIAAAPNLLAALDAVMPDLEHYVSTHGPGPDKRLDQARAAIAKARNQ